MQVEIKLSGFAELAAQLKALPDNIGRNGLRAAVAAGAAEVRKQTRLNALAIKDTGTLARSIYQKQIREESSLHRQTFYVGARQGKKYQKQGKRQVSADAYYARFVEFGHFTRPARSGKRTRLLRNTDRGQDHAQWLSDEVQAGNVKWVPPSPFLRPAFDSKKMQAIDAMAVKLRERIERFKATGK
jgi:HK97 gp10 family phage protein